MKTRILTLLLSSIMFVFGRQSFARSTVLNDKIFDKNEKEFVFPTNEIIDNQKTQFYLKESANNAYKKLYYRNDDNEEELIFDPNEYKDDSGNLYLIKSFSPNYQGTKVCLNLGLKKAKKTILYIVDVQTKKVHKEQIDNCTNQKVSWMDDGNSFMYCRKYIDVSPSGELFGNILIHIIGTDPSEDRLVSFSKELPEYY